MVAPLKLDRRRGAAVDAESCPCHEGAQWTGDKADCEGDILRMPEPGHRLPDYVFYREVLTDLQIVAALLLHQFLEPRDPREE